MANFNMPCKSHLWIQIQCCGRRPFSNMMTTFYAPFSNCLMQRHGNSVLSTWSCNMQWRIKKKKASHTYAMHIGIYKWSSFTVTWMRLPFFPSNLKWSIHRVWPVKLVVIVVASGSSPHSSAPMLATTQAPAAFNTEHYGSPQTPNRGVSSSRGSSTTRRQRKERHQNWQVQETLVLIHAKRTEHFWDKSKIDQRDLMCPEVTRWTLIADEVMRAGYSPCIRDGTACKVKWNQLVPDYKRIFNYHGRSGQNVQDF